MGTVVLACGCSISHSMFGDKPYLNIGLCLKHAEIPEIASAMKAVVKAIDNNSVKKEEIKE